MSLPYCFHKINIFSDVIILDSSTTFQTNNFISCDTSCDHSHILLHCLKKKETKQNKIKIK